MVQRGPNIVTGGDRRRYNLRQHQEKQRHRNVYSVDFRPSIISGFVDRNARFDENDFAVYGIYKDDETGMWVLVGFAFCRYVERATTDRRGGTTSKLKGRYLYMSDAFGNFSIRDGLEIARGETKSELMGKASADGSERVDTGEYLIRAKHNPRVLIEDVDRDEYREFTQNARKLYWD